MDRFAGLDIVDREIEVDVRRAERLLDDIRSYWLERDEDYVRWLDEQRELVLDESWECQ